MTKLWRKNTPFPFKGEGNQIGKEWWQWAKILLLYIPNDKSSYFLFSQSHQQELMLVQQIITYKVLEPIHSAKTTWPSPISITPNLQMRKLRLRMSRGLLSTSQCWFHDPVPSSFYYSARFGQFQNTSHHFFSNQSGKHQEHSEIKENDWRVWPD